MARTGKAATKRKSNRGSDRAYVWKGNRLLGRAPSGSTLTEVRHRYPDAMSVSHGETRESLKRADDAVPGWKRSGTSGVYKKVDVPWRHRALDRALDATPVLPRLYNQHREVVRGLTMIGAGIGAVKLNQRYPEGLTPLKLEASTCVALGTTTAALIARHYGYKRVASSFVDVTIGAVAGTVASDIGRGKTPMMAG
jgi:hypothetical protein